jgi:hypothetical protein
MLQLLTMQNRRGRRNSGWFLLQAYFCSEASFKWFELNVSLTP